MRRRRTIKRIKKKRVQRKMKLGKFSNWKLGKSCVLLDYGKERASNDSVEQMVEKKEKREIEKKNSLLLFDGCINT